MPTLHGACTCVLLALTTAACRQSDTVAHARAAEMLVNLEGPHRFWGGLSQYSFGIFIVSLQYALASRFVREHRRLRKMSDHVLAAHEDERRRLSRELHDGVGQSLMAIKLNLLMMQARSQAAMAGAGPQPSELVSAVSQTIDELRQVAAGLRPDYLEELSLGDALKWYAGEFERRSGVRIGVHADEAASVSPKIKDHLFRIYQEALGNIQKHAGASRIDVTFGARDGRVSLTISDDGAGFDPRASSHHAGIGLATIRERAELLSGSCRVASAPGAGTTMTVEVPLDEG